MDMTGWISSKDRMPPEEVGVLCARDGFSDILHLDRRGGVWFNGENGWASVEDYGPFWWRFLPDAPEENP